MQSSANQTDRHPLEPHASSFVILNKAPERVARTLLSAAFDLTVPGTQRLSRQSTVQQAILSTIDLTQIDLTQGKNRVWRRHSCPPPTSQRISHTAQFRSS